MKNVFKPVYFSRYTDNSLPAFVGEKRILVIERVSNQEIYNTFYKNLNTYMLKIPASPAKQAVSMLINKKLILLGKDIDASKNGIIGTVFISHDALAGVVLEVADLEINPETGETSNIDQCFYAIYFEFIRTAVLINRDKIRSNTEIHKLCIQFLTYLMLRLLGRGIQLSTKQRNVFEIVVKYFFYRYEMSETHPLSVDKALKQTSKELAQELLPLFESIKKTTKFRDIFTVLMDFKITQQSPNSLIILSLKKLKAAGFFSVFTSLDYLIAFIIILNYPIDFVGAEIINTSIQIKLENIMQKYIKRVKFDVKAIR